jgi:plasmid stability protein
MGVVLTVRTDEALREALRRRAATQGKTISELVREILESAVQERPIAERAGHLRGCLELPATDDDPWVQHMRRTNWRS